MKPTQSKIVGGVAVAILAIAFLTVLSSQAFAQNRAATARIFLEPGDIVLSINGEPIGGKYDLTNAVNRSGRIMYFTIQDRRTGSIMSLATRLNDQGYRFGVYSVDNGGYGARITAVMQGAAASRCWSDDSPWAASPGGPGSMPAAAAAPSRSTATPKATVTPRTPVTPKAVAPSTVQPGSSKSQVPQSLRIPQNLPPGRYRLADGSIIVIGR